MKKIKLESTTQKPIQIFEFKAYSSGVNIAVLGSAVQSSSLNDNIRFRASLAIDGINSTFSHTKAWGAWLEIDLPAPTNIENVAILNRWCVDSSDPKGCLCRLSNSMLTLYGANGVPLSRLKLGNTCGSQVVSQPLMPCSNS